MTEKQQKLVDTYTKWGEHAPEWLQPLINGRIFNVEQWHRFDANEVYLDHPDGSRTILDSYTPDEAVVSRKNTIIGEHPDATRAYINEFVKKYPAESAHVTVADTPSNRANPALADSIGRPLTGPMKLEVPVQPVPIPRSILDYATEKGITIVDVTGHAYN